MARSEQKKAEKKKYVTTSIQKGRKRSGFIKPMLAKQTETPFNNKDWLFEIKWDGYRAITEKTKKQIALYSRNGISFESSYPIVVDQLNKIDHDVVLDGEVVVLDEDGSPNFQFLQHYSENAHRPIQYYIFDLLNLDGTDTTDLTVVERKELLLKIIPDNEVIKYSDHILEKGKAFFEVSKEKKLEGIMAKKCDSKYYPGKRTSDWLKIKNHLTQEAIIAGYTEPAGTRKYFGALILGSYVDGILTYIGHTGTGFNQHSLNELFGLLQPLEQDKSPFEEKIKTNMPVTWVKPELICEVKFSEMTKDRKLRHPVFMHLREDKNVDEVSMDEMDDGKERAGRKTKTAQAKIDETDKTYTFGKSKVKVSNLNKIYFPKDGITKGDVVEYYLSMSDYILPYLKGRPESLLRNPNGINKKGFFHKDAAGDAPSFVKRKKVFSDSTKKNINYILCDNEATLVYLNNLGCIEINPWHSTVGALDMPDYLIVDIDPSEKNTFEQVINAANVLKQILDKAGAVSFCKTSGASGLHIYVPTAKKYTYDQVKDFTYLVCTIANNEMKKFTTLERNLKKRGNKHIYLDYLQNRKGQTISSVYSLRPKPECTVSTPLLWQEVTSGLSPRQFTIHNIKDRVESIGDIFKGVMGKGIDILKCIENLSS